MNTEYLELLFQHKFATKRDIEQMRTINTFPADTSDYDVYKAKLGLTEKHLSDIQKLIEGYIYFHETK